jgi:hypothetical protein
VLSLHEDQRFELFSSSFSAFAAFPHLGTMQLTAPTLLAERTLTKTSSPNCEFGIPDGAEEAQRGITPAD